MEASTVNQAPNVVYQDRQWFFDNVEEVPSPSTKNVGRVIKSIKPEIQGFSKLHKNVLESIIKDLDPKNPDASPKKPQKPIQPPSYPKTPAYEYYEDDFMDDPVYRVDLYGLFAFCFKTSVIVGGTWLCFRTYRNWSSHSIDSKTST